MLSSDLSVDYCHRFNMPRKIQHDALWLLTFLARTVQFLCAYGKLKRLNVKCGSQITFLDE